MTSPNNEYRNDTLVSRVGFFLGSTTNIGATLRRVETRFGSPNGIHFYGIPDDSNSRGRFTYSTVRSVSDIDRVRTTFQYSYTEQDALYTNPTPTGEEFDPFGFGANYLGDHVTITGQNGYSVTGRAILDYGGVYPSVFSTNSKRHLFTGKADMELLDGLDLSFGGRIEDESGFTTFASLADRRNHGWFIEGRGNIHQRFFVTGGVGFEDNAVFGHETVPRLSLAFYARQPSLIGPFGETKLMFNIGEGIKAPTVSDDRSSLFAVLSGLDNGCGPDRSVRRRPNRAGTRSHIGRRTRTEVLGWPSSRRCFVLQQQQQGSDRVCERPDTAAIGSTGRCGRFRSALARRSTRLRSMHRDWSFPETWRWLISSCFRGGTRSSTRR